MIIIDDPNDERIAVFRVRDRALHTRAQRRENVVPGLFIAEGDLVVQRALDAGCTPVAAFVDVAAPPPLICRFGPGVDVFAADEDVRRVGMGLGVPLSIVAVFQRPHPLDPRVTAAVHRVVVLEAVDNPVNVGTVVRSAVALGWGGLLLDRASADPLARRALRVAMGNSFALPFARSDSLSASVAEAKRRGALVVALTPRPAAIALHDLRPRPSQAVMLLLGSERHGLTEELLEAASVRASIAMVEGIDSLNAAAAAAIACYVLRPGSVSEDRWRC